MIPSRRLVVLYVITAHVFLALAFALTAWNPRAVAGFFYHSRIVAIVHLVTIGWIAMSILGSTYVVLPLAFGTAFPARAADYAAFALVGIGVIGMVAHFWMAEFGGMAWSAATAACGVAYVATRLALRVRHAKVPGGVKLHIYFASANMLAAVTMGVLLGFDKVHHFLPGYVLSNVFAHAHLAAVGWACMMVVGLGYRLVPMVLPAAMPSGPTVCISAILLETGIIGLFWALVMRTQWTLLFAIIIVAGFAAFGAHVLWMLKRPKAPPRNGAHRNVAMVHIGAAGVWLLFACVCGLTLTALPVSEWTLRLALLYGTFGLVGFLAQVIVGFETAPLARTVGPFLWLLGVPAIGAGLFLDMPALLSGGAWLLLSATLLAGVNIAGLLGVPNAGIGDKPSIPLRRVTAWRLPYQGRMRVECAIVGGGISGLAAAHELHSRGIPFVLIESAARYGGLIRTEHVDGFVVDAGPDALLTYKPAGVALCRELGIRLSPARSTGAFVAHRGRLRALPEAGVFGIPTEWKAFARSRAFSAVGKLRMAGEYFLPPVPALADGDESIASFIERRFGREALQRLGEPLLAGIHGGDAARLSMRALFPRFLDLERTDGSVIRGLRRLRHGTVTSPPVPFVSVCGGTETLVKALVRSLPRASLISDVAVQGLEQGREWRVHLANGTHVDAAAVLLATPPRVIAGLVHQVDPVLSALCGRVRDVSLITVALGYRRDAVRHPLSGSGFVVPRSEGATVTAVTWMSSKWSGRAPEDGVLLRASVGGARDPNAADWPDADIVARVREDVRRYLQVSSAPVFSRVYRMPHAGVQLDVGHLNLIGEAEARAARLPGLFISAAGFRGVGLADCVGDARTQAIAVARYTRSRIECRGLSPRPARLSSSQALQSRHAAHPQRASTDALGRGWRRDCRRDPSSLVCGQPAPRRFDGL